MRGQVEFRQGKPRGEACVAPWRSVRNDTGVRWWLRKTNQTPFFFFFLFTKEMNKSFKEKITKNDERVEMNDEMMRRMDHH
jgi:hypothetical protein